MRFSLMLGVLLAGSAASAATPNAPLPFVANKGQWEPRVKYAVTLPSGQLYLEGNAFTYSLHASAPHGPEATEGPKPVAGHAYRVTMVGAAAMPVMDGEEEQATYHNYFIGNDPRHWASRVPLYAGVRYHNAYPGVDVRWHQKGEAQLEYDFELAPGARPEAIRLRYDGLESMSLTPAGHLQLRTSIGEQREQAPVAWQVSASGVRRAVPCRFVLRDKEISFALGQGYDPAQRLIIDPVLVFATYSGVGANGLLSANAAISDAQGNMYTGGYVLNGTYPVSPGAFNTGANTTNSIMGISKLSADGRNRIYATYLGGYTNGGDSYPLDFEINAAGELLILGTTSSADYPTMAGAYDRTLGTGSFPGFSHDLVITRFNATGTALLASTFLGGAGEEAGSTSAVPAAVTVDPSGDVLVVSSTLSTDYPVLNAQQATFGGGLDGVLTRLNPGLTALRWSTYVGGAGQDRAHDVKVAPNGDVYVCGVTNSLNMPVGTGGLIATAPGGYNGYVLRYSATGTRLSGTYLGDTGYDVARFLDFTTGGQVLVGGATDGNYPRTTGTFSAVVPNTTSIFVHALAPALNTTLFSTQISVLGSNALSSSNVLTGFGRDDCGRLYFSAYAGAISSPGCPRTPDAFSSAPRSIYLAVLSDNASALLYGTYIGEVNNSVFASGSTHLHFAASNQVTRGGTLYHITCNIGRSFGTTPGAYSAGLTQSNDGAAFKFDLQPQGGGSGVQLVVSTPQPTACATTGLKFVNNTLGSLIYSWDFGDGSAPDTARAPLHTYAVPGTYTARVTGTRRATANGCGPGTATTTLFITVIAPPAARVVADSLGCGRALVLNPQALNPPVSGRGYRWSTGSETAGLSVTAAGTYRVEVDQGQTCPAIVVYNVKAVPAPSVRTVVDSLDCGLRLVLDPSRLSPRPSGTLFQWSTGAQTPTIAVSSPGRYRLEIDQGRFCPTVIEYEVKLKNAFQLPNIITANGDELNAKFKIPNSYGTPELKVYNRYGRMVYESAAYHSDWGGAGLASGVYYYFLRQPNCNIDLKGWVEIVR